MNSSPAVVSRRRTKFWCRMHPSMSADHEFTLSSPCRVRGRPAPPVHEPAGGAAARARIIIQNQRRRSRASSAQQHATMVVRPLVGMTGDGVATLELRRTHQSTCARVQNGAQQVLVEGTRRAVPIGTSSSSFYKIRWSGSSVTSSQERRVRRPSARRARSGQPTGCSARLPVTRVGVLILHHVGWSRSLSLRLGCVPGACCCTPCRAGRSASSGGASFDAPAAGLISPG